MMMMTTRKRHSPEQAVRKLGLADRMLGEGKDVADVCRELQVAEQTYYRWRNQFGGLKADDVKRLKELERENQEPRRVARLLVRCVRDRRVRPVHRRVAGVDVIGDRAGSRRPGDGGVGPP